MTDTPRSAKSTTATDQKFEGLSDVERAAMKERTKELKAEARRGARGQGQGGRGTRGARQDRRDAGTGSRHGRAAPRDHQSQRPGPVAENLVRDARLPKDGKIVCFFQAADKFKSRYATFGFDVAANLDDGSMWPTAFALTELTAADEARIGALVKKAVG
jgi:hypothetical protein